MKFKLLKLTISILLGSSVLALAGKNDPVETKKETPMIDASSVGYAACRGCISYGGKVFAVWLAGSNPATATVLLVGLVGGQIGGHGFDAVTKYLKTQNITPPTEEEINELISEFVEIEEEEIIELGEDENGELIPLGADGNPIEIGILPEYPEPTPLTYTQRVQRLAQNTFDTGYTGAVTFIRGLPRLGATTITGTLAGTIAQLLGGDFAAAAVGAATGNVTGQAYDRVNVIVINEQEPSNAVVIDNTGEGFFDPEFEPVLNDLDAQNRVAQEGFERMTIMGDYIEVNEVAEQDPEAIQLPMIDDFVVVNPEDLLLEEPGRMARSSLLASFGGWFSGI